MQGQDFGQLKLLMEEKLQFLHQQHPIRTFKDDDNLVRTKIENNVFGRNQLTVYDGNTDNVAYNFSIYEDSPDKREYNITYSFVSKMGSRDWNYTDVTMDQWTKFLNMITLLSAPIIAALSDRFRTILTTDESVFTPIKYNGRYVGYEMTKDLRIPNRLWINRYFNITSHNVTPYDPRLEQAVNRYASELSDAIQSMFPNFNG